MTESTAAALTEASRPCSACGKPVDPLRAARVAHIRDRFRYFCSAECRTRFDTDVGATPLPVARGRSLSAAVQEAKSAASVHEARDEREATRAAAEVAREPAVPKELEASLVAAPSEEPSPAVADDVPLVVDARGGLGASGLLLMLAGLGAVLAVGLIFAGPSRAVLAARVVLAAVACAALVTERTTSARDASELHPAVFSAAPIGAAGIAWGTLLVGDPRASDAALLTSVIVCLSALSVALVRRARRPLDAARERLAVVMNGTARRVVDEGTVEAQAVDLRPGEEILIEAGDVVPADATVTAGEGVALPWLDA